MRLNFKANKEIINNNKLSMFKSSLIDSDTMPRELLWYNPELRDSRRWTL